MRATAHCLDSIQFGASEGPNPAGLLDVSIVSIRFDLGPLAAWGPPDVSMSRLSRFGWIWGLEARWYRYIWYMAYDDISIPILPVRSSNLDEAVSVRGPG